MLRLAEEGEQRGRTFVDPSTMKLATAARSLLFVALLGKRRAACGSSSVASHSTTFTVPLHERCQCTAEGSAMTAPPRPCRSGTEQAASGRMSGDAGQGDTHAPPQSNPGTEWSDSGASAQIPDVQIACVHAPLRYTCRSPVPRHRSWPRPETQVGRDLSDGRAATVLRRSQKRSWCRLRSTRSGAQGRGLQEWQGARAGPMSLRSSVEHRCLPRCVRIVTPACVGGAPGSNDPWIRRCTVCALDLTRRREKFMICAANMSQRLCGQAGVALVVERNTRPAGSEVECG